MNRWLEGLPTVIRKRLAKLDLIDGRRVAAAALVLLTLATRGVQF